MQRFQVNLFRFSDFTTKLDVNISKAYDEAEGNFTCVVAGENKDFSFSWFIG